MNGKLFPFVMKHFIQHNGSSKENHTILIYDNHESHLTIETLNTAKANRVVIVTFPPPHIALTSCRHWIPPCSPLSRRTIMLLHHPGAPLSIYDIAGCVGVAFERSMSPSNIKSRFKETGIYPIDRNVFTANDFLSCFVTDREVIMPPSVLPSTSDDQIPFISTIPSTLTIQSTSTIPSPSTTLCNVDNPKKFVSPEIFKSYRKVGERKLKRNRRKKATSCIPTDTFEKDEIELKCVWKKKTKADKES